MNSKTSIIDKILGDAQIEATKILSEAEESVRGTLTLAKSNAEKSSKLKLQGLEKLKGDIIERNKSVAVLDTKKYLLSQKTLFMDKLFSQALKKAMATPDKEYAKLIEGLLEKSAEDGDVVIICKDDAKRITKSLVKDVAKKKNITLTLDNEFGDFYGGFVLSSKNCDKNCTFDLSLQMLRENIESQVAKKLFEE